MAGLRPDSSAPSKGLHGALLKALFETDPIQLKALGCPSDEYEPEVKTILLRLPSSRSLEDAITIVFEEFRHWFGETAGSRSSYEEAGRAVWEAWLSHGEEGL